MAATVAVAIVETNRMEAKLMARAVQVFKTNLLRQRELEEQQRPIS
ncbi:hypothetical protein [Telmatospirillum siberiense]|nr:hypothetical protein [Telmatospirillum siberiense]